MDSQCHSSYDVFISLLCSLPTCTVFLVIDPSAVLLRRLNMIS
jgi:hypothetical protein